MEIRFLFFSFFIFFLLSCEENDSFYFDSINGSDQNPGSKELPFRSIKKINDINLKNNSHIYLSNGSLFKGSINLLNKRNIMITNYNEEEYEDKPIIDSKGNLAGILVENSSFTNISNIQITANGGNESSKPHKLINRDLRAGILYIVSDKNTHKNF